MYSQLLPVGWSNEVILTMFLGLWLVTTLMTLCVVVMAAETVQPAYPQPPPGTNEPRDLGTRQTCPCSSCHELACPLCAILLGRLLRVDIIKWVSNVRPPVCTPVRPSVHIKFIRFRRNVVCRQKSMSDAWRYVAWPDPRSRSRALESRKFDHFKGYFLPHL